MTGDPTGGVPAAARAASLLVSVLLGIVLAGLGVVLGVAGTLLHGVSLRGVPVGLVGIALATFGATQLAGRGARSRPFAVIPGLCWLLVVVVLTAGRPEGDYLVGGGWIDWGYLLAGTAGVAVGLFLTPAYPRPAAARPGAITGREEAAVPPRAE